MASFTTRLADGWEKAGWMTTLALVPAVVTVTSLQNIVNTLSASRTGGGVAFLIPTGIVNLWSFVSVPSPQQGEMTLDIGGIPVGSFEAAATALGLVFVTTVVRATLAAGYFGSIREGFTSEKYDFQRNVRRYAVRMLGYELLPLVALLPAILFALEGGAVGFALFVPVFLSSLVAGYLLAATPYLVVLRDLSLVEALVESVRVTTTVGFFRFVLALFVAALPLSFALSTVVRQLGVVGILCGALMLAPVGLACNAATMRLVADVDPQSPSLGTWDDAPRQGEGSGPAPMQ
ncbi:hypothetical protein AUR64_16410 [Haloprofundus marisrubri]|uniref:Glycerophosphoryl diester phosphodiesterase membrane domain-containing protein n=1 Tax=Haloprofundus marisrubri TaxID=1514971 RepID=A0A0W1R873_9EURY|nr:hypothetical protein [Haloprofundus marisrubri]KTG09362.1 hypothetical protein AUR64_16410 [Haloprofundus marisrubri]